MPNPPKFDPARGARSRGPVKLPAEGRSGPAPDWPLLDQTIAEDAAWKELWATPHAVAWEHLGWLRTVARYCRVMCSAELPDASPALLAQATAMEDRLGLTPKAMRLLLWEIVSDEVGDQRKQASTGARRRIKAV